MSKIEVDEIVKQSGSTLTLGGPGTAVTLGSGATQTGFGRTGTIDWCTTAKTSPFTAVSGDGFFVNTTSGVITVTLPASPSAGDIVAFKDYAGTWDSNEVTLCRNGSKINGACFNAALSTENQSVTLIYVDGTKGWQDINDSTSGVTGGSFISATGGTITTDGLFKIHTFTSSGTFCVSSVSNLPVNNTVSYLVVAGGGSGGGSCHGAGGGAGGFREGKHAPLDPYTASPLVAPAGITVTAQGYPITIGAGGSAAANSTGSSGSNSVFSTITSAGGGGGGGYQSSPAPGLVGKTGGSGGGGIGNSPSAPNAGGAGNTPPVSPPQGNNGGAGAGAPPYYGGGGGGGATAAGADGTGPGGGGDGGDGASTQITGSAVVRAGGGGGSMYRDSPSQPTGLSGSGGSGGGGAGSNAQGTSGTANTGGGGGGSERISGPSNTPNAAGSGGSGVVIIRYKFQ